MKCNHGIVYVDFIVSVISIRDDIRSINLLQVAHTVLYKITPVSTVLADGAWKGMKESHAISKVNVHQAKSPLYLFHVLFQAKNVEGKIY